jgi:hypothetical protein
MAQANPNAGGPQPASYQELYALMSNVLDGIYMTYLAPFGPESGEQPATLWDCIISERCPESVRHAFAQSHAPDCVCTSSYMLCFVSPGGTALRRQGFWIPSRCPSGKSGQSH